MLNMVVLLKLGGSMLKNKELLEKIAKTIGEYKGERFVIVHGGGPNISALMQKKGKQLSASSSG